MPGGISRNEYALETLKRINGKLEFKSLVEALADSRKVNAPDDIASLINEIIKHDGYKLEKDDYDIFKVKGKELNDPVAIEAHFQEIKSQIVDSIRNAKYLIWVAVAWFTDDKVPFDLNTFKYVQVSQAAEIPGKLKPEIIAILKDAGAIINGGDL